MTKQRFIMMRAVSGSGKTTYAKNLQESQPNWKRVNRDDLRMMVDNGKWTGKNEKLIIKLRDQIIKQALEDGYNVINDDTNLTEEHEMAMRRIAELYEIELEIVELNVPLLECIERDAKRPNPVGKKVIYKQWRQLHPENNFLNDGKPLAFCFDIDGTIALMGNRNPYDASTCLQDKLNEPVARVLRKLANDYIIILCSGRENKYRQQTVEWLEKHNLRFDRLFMRESGDNRKDSIIKKEIYQQEILPKYNVLGVFDDREQVVSMLRDELNMMVFAVDYGMF